MRVTPFIVGLAAWVAWLYQRTQSADFLVSTITLARRTEKEETEIGTFLDILFVRASLMHRSSFSDLVTDLRGRVLQALDQYVPLWELLELIPGLARALSSPSTLLLPFQVLTEDLPTLTQFGDCTATLLERSVSRNAGYSLPFDGLVTMKWATDHYALIFEYRSNVLTTSAANQLLVGFRTWMDDALTSPNKRLYKSSLA
jgi:non-ribosomal peptide synthetase component F